MKYILGIDQSTQGTKALVFNQSGEIMSRADCPHEQIINEKGWVSHNAEEIYQSTLKAVKAAVESAEIDKKSIAAVGISNQRETSLIWERESGRPLNLAVVWQCDRAKDICEKLTGSEELVKAKTGLNLSPYFPAAKWAWLLKNSKINPGKALCAGTIDSWLVFKLTNGKSFKTDYSNASRTQLFNINTLSWDEELCSLFGVPEDILPEVCFSDSEFGMTDFEGFLPVPVPILGVLGDSHGALFGQGCLSSGMTKATYGTGSSVMMNIGDRPVICKSGVVTSVAWGMNGKLNFVLEGNINYTGAVTRWIVDDLNLISSSREAGAVAQTADESDETYLVPAFTGLGAPYWRSDARAMFFGMSRTTGRRELVKAAEECIAYQINDVLEAMQAESGVKLNELRVDGGPTGDRYLMQFQSDILGIPVSIPEREELSCMGAAFCAGICAGVYGKDIALRLNRHEYRPVKDAKWRDTKLSGWKKAINTLIK